MRFFFTLLFVCLITPLFAQPCTGGSSSGPVPTKCFEIVSILVDACDGALEGQNEMIRLKIGNTPLLVSGFSIPAYGGSGFVNWGAGAGNPWRGFANFTAPTLAKITTINNSISTSGHCGKLIPLNNTQFAPAKSEFLIITSTDFNPLAQSFDNLMDTLYVVIQTAGNTGGHFANYSTGTPVGRTLIINHTLCSDTVTYDKTKLIKQNQSIGAEDGGVANFTFGGVDSYSNNGCAIPIIPITYDAGIVTAPFCSGSSVQLNGSITGTSCYVWLAKDTSQGSFSDTTILNPLFNIKAGLGAVSVTLYLKVRSICAFETKDSVTFTVTPSTVLMDAGKDTSICASTILKLFATSNSAGTITWTSSGLGSFSSTTILQPNFIPAAGQNGIVYLRFRQQTTCGTYTDSLKVTLLSAPSPAFTWPAGALCAGGTAFALSPTLTGGVFSGTGVVGGIFTPSTSGSFPVKYVISVAGCIDSSTQNIIVSAKPNPAFTWPAGTLCVGDPSFGLSPTVTGGIFSGAGVVGNTFNPSTSGSFPVKYVLSVAGCADSLTQNITVNPKPNASFAPSALLVCEKSPMINLNPVQTGGNFYIGNVWFMGNRFDPQVPGTYIIKYDINVSGCTDSSKQTIVVEPKPNSKFNLSDTVFCTGDPQLVLTGIVPGGVFSGPFVTGNLFDPSTAGNYSIQYTLVQGTCRDSSVRTVKVIQTPTASFSYNPMPGAAKEPVQFTYTGTTATQFRWEFGMPIIGSDNIQDPKFAFPSAGFYNVKLWVSNEGCLDSTEDLIEVVTNDTLIVPNVFTPNGDSINDCFGVVALGIKQFTIYIFNRWGGQVFEGNSVTQVWDGKYKNNPCPEDVYFYVIEARAVTNHSYSLHGTVTLMR